MHPASPPPPLPPASFYMQLLAPRCRRRPGSVGDHHASRTKNRRIKGETRRDHKRRRASFVRPSLIAADSTHRRRRYQGSTQRQRRRE